MLHAYKCVFTVCAEYKNCFVLIICHTCAPFIYASYVYTYVSTICTKYKNSVFVTYLIESNESRLDREKRKQIGHVCTNGAAECRIHSSIIYVYIYSTPIYHKYMYVYSIITSLYSIIIYKEGCLHTYILYPHTYISNHHSNTFHHHIYLFYHMYYD